MRQASYVRYGSPDVVRVTDAATPTPGPGEVLVRVRATTVGAADAAARAGSPAFARLYFGLPHPRIPVLGSDFAGEVVAVGSGAAVVGAADVGAAVFGAADFGVGDRVFGVTGSAMGGHVTHLVVPADAAIALQPSGVTDAEAAALVDATALSFLRDTAQLRTGQRVLVIGASGSVGTMAVQLAVAFGARVTGACSDANVELVSSLGAERVIDYTVEDWWAASGRPAQSIGDGRGHRHEVERFDVIFDAVGASSYRRARASLADGGIYLRTVPTLALLLQTAWTSLASRLPRGHRDRGRRDRGRTRAATRTRALAIAFTGLRPTAEKARDLAVVRDLVSAGAVRAVIDSSYPLDAIADAHRRVDTHRKRGAVVVTMDE